MRRIRGLTGLAAVVGCFISPGPPVLQPGRSLAMPVYPDAMRRVNAEGRERLAFPLGADGAVDTARARVLSSSHRMFSDAVKLAVVNWRFVGRSRGRPDTVVVEFEFTLGRDGCPQPPCPRADSLPPEPPVAAAPQVAFDAARLEGRVQSCPGQRTCFRIASPHRAAGREAPSRSVAAATSRSCLPSVGAASSQPGREVPAKPPNGTIGCAFTGDAQSA